MDIVQNLLHMTCAPLIPRSNNKRVGSSLDMTSATKQELCSLEASYDQGGGSRSERQ